MSERVLCISLWQPWATLIAIGAKRVETRDFATTYRGTLAIHAGLAFTLEQSRLLVKEPYRAVLNKAGIHLASQLPRGAIVATCRIVAVFRAETVAPTLEPNEWLFGDFTAGRYAWMLDDVRPLPSPIRTRGQPGLWDVTALLDANDWKQDHE